MYYSKAVTGMNQAEEIKRLRKLYIRLVKEACEIKNTDPDFFDLGPQLAEINIVHGLWMDEIRKREQNNG
jgi:hypothetical protein